jgi:HK97 family phage prohead protease
MPYGISQNQPDCSRWAAVVEREDGSFETLACYDTKQEAIDRMVAQSLAEDLEPIGEVGVRQMEMEEPSDDVEQMIEGLAEQDEYNINPRQAAMYDIFEKIADEFGAWDKGVGGNGSHYVEQSPFAEDGMICANCVFYEGGGGCEIVSGDIAPNGICKLWIISEEKVSISNEVEQERSIEQRQVSLTTPDFMAASARRGLRLHEEGFSGDGLMPATVADARRMANGEALSEAKWRKIPAWIARHIVDLDAVQGDEITAGLVAMLLWGGGSSKTSARRAQAYAQRIVDRLDAEGDRNVISEDVICSPSMAELREAIADPTEVRWCVKQADEKRFVAFTNLEARQDGDGNKLIGYASVFDSPSEPMPFVEYVRRGAFAKTLNDGADVRLLIDHDGVPLARTRSGTLMLEEDDRGLRVEASLDPMNPDAARVISAMKRGDISQMSFAFRTIKDNWNSDRSVRELKEVQLYDVSVVTFPAYEETVAEIRSGQTAQETTTIVSNAPVRLRSAQIALARRHSRD